MRALIEAILEADWTPIPYGIQGGADVAETTYTPFRHRAEAAPVRLIVRHVKTAARLTAGTLCTSEPVL